MVRYSVKAGVMSAVFMGLGQMYNRQIIKGIFFSLVEILYIIFVLPYNIDSIRGLVTLGEKPQEIVDGKIIQGDHSIFLMVFGIISIIVLLLFFVLYLLNIRDAIMVGKQREQGRMSGKIIDSLKTAAEKGFPYLFLSPAGILILFITVVPLIFGILIAFTNYSSPNHLPPRNLVDWVGFSNFVSLFELQSFSRTFFGVALWTVIWAVVSSVSAFFTGMFFAVLINSKGVTIKRFWRTTFILPWAMPGFISILIMRNMFNGQFGPINKYLQAFGLSAIPWLADQTWAKITCLIVNLWLAFPYYMAMMSGVLTSISKELYEAAAIEGANARKQFTKITFPIVMYSTAPLLIMGIAHNFNNFNLIYLLTMGNPTNTAYSYAGHTDILLSWLYKLTLDQSQFHMASVVSIIIFIIVALMSIVNFSYTKSFREEDIVQ